MGGGVRRRVVDVVSSKGCTAMLSEAASSFRKNDNDSFHHSPDSDHQLALDGPFSGLVICITGLSKETRKQVKDVTEKLGGVYSTNLHSLCTHLVLQSAKGLKLNDQTIKHASSAKGGLSVVTIGWFVDSVRRKLRLSEELYTINNQTATSIRKFTGHTTSESTCISVNSNQIDRGGFEQKTTGSILAGKTVYIDPDISLSEHKKVLEACSNECVTLLKKWSAGCGVDYVVCEGATVGRYLGHGRMGALVTPAWILNTAKACKSQKLVLMSEDLAKQVQTMLEHCHVNHSEELRDKNMSMSGHTTSEDINFQQIHNLCRDITHSYNNS